MLSLKNSRCRRHVAVWLVAGFSCVVSVMVFIPQVSAQDGATSAKASEELSLRSPVTWLLKPLDVPNAEAATETAMKPYTEKIPSADVKFDMVPIPGGKFLMGSPESEGDRKKDEGPQVEVGIEPFWMGKFEVTWEEYELWGMGLDKQIRKVTGAKSSEHEIGRASCRERV